jgi:hypothetical protein
MALKRYLHSGHHSSGTDHDISICNTKKTGVKEHAEKITKYPTVIRIRIEHFWLFQIRGFNDQKLGRKCTADVGSILWKQNASLRILKPQKKPSALKRRNPALKQIL